MNKVYEHNGYTVTWERVTGLGGSTIINGEKIRPGSNYFKFNLTGNGVNKTYTVNLNYPVVTPDVINSVVNIFKKYMV